MNLFWKWLTISIAVPLVAFPRRRQGLRMGDATFTDSLSVSDGCFHLVGIYMKVCEVKESNETLESSLCRKGF